MRKENRIEITWFVYSLIGIYAGMLYIKHDWAYAVTFLIIFGIITGFFNKEIMRWILK